MGGGAFSNGGTSCMEAHADLMGCQAEARTGPLPSGELLLHAQGRQHRAWRMILLRHGSAKDDQDTLPTYSPDQAPILLGLMARQLMQHVQPALPDLQAPLLTLHGGSHEGATQDRDHFPLARRERVIYRQWDRGLRRACRLQGNWRIRGSYRGRHRQE
jgi:hypothetical protein